MLDDTLYEYFIYLAKSPILCYFLFALPFTVFSMWMVRQIVCSLITDSIYLEKESIIKQCIREDYERFK